MSDKCENCGSPATHTGEFAEGRESGGRVPLCLKCATKYRCSGLRPIEAPSELAGPTGSGRWRSYAKWDHSLGFEEDTTTDSHGSKEAALAVCDILQREGLGGNRVHFPVKTWVAEIP